MKSMRILTMGTLVAGVTLLSGCRASVYDRTLAELDQGGETLQYVDVRDFMPKIQNAVDIAGKFVVDQVPPARRMQFSLGVGAVSGLVKQLNLESIQAIGNSSIKLGERNYRYKSFVYTGDELPQGLLFDLVGRRNGSLESLKSIPGDAVLAFGSVLEADVLYKNIVQQLAKSNPMIAEGVQGLERSYKQATGMELKALLASLQGEAYGYIALDDKDKVRFYLSIPDAEGALAQLLRRQLTFKDNRFAIPLPMRPDVALLSTVEPTLILGDKRVILQSMAKMPESPALTGDLAKWVASAPRKGLGYACVNLNERVEKIVCREFAGQPVAQLFPYLKRPAGFQVSFLKKDGYATIGWATHSQIDMQFMLPVMMAGNGLFKSMNAAQKRARSMTELGHAKQIGLGMMLYANDNGDRLPAPDGVEGFKKLEKLLPHAAVFQQTGVPDAVKTVGALTEKTCAYHYIGGGIEVNKVRKPSQTPIVFGKPDRGFGEYIPVLFLDGHVEAVQVKNYTRAIQVLNALKETNRIPAEIHAQLVQKVAQLR